MRTNDSPRIQIEIEGGSPKTFDRAFTIGRDESSDVVVDDDCVSQHHLEVALAAGVWEVRDLDSTNGTFINGRRVDRKVVRDRAELRLVHEGGPTLFLNPLYQTQRAHDTALPNASDHGVAERYFGEEAPEEMSDRTRLVRVMIHQQKRSHSTRLRVAAGFVVLLGALSVALVAVQRRQAARQIAAASDLFYQIKALELDVRRLQEAAGEQMQTSASQADLEAQYQEFVEALDIYGSDTPEEVRIIYRVIRRFGESEINVPEEFIEEVLRYIDQWKGPGLPRLIARAERNGYGRRIAEVFAEHDLPPHFFYLALQESGFDADAVGPPTRFGFAKGMWQFIPMTGESYGLNIGPLREEPRPDPLDDRHDFELSTRAAAEYIRWLYATDAQASGLLVMASYNWGEGNVLPLIRSMPASPRERNFWNLLTQYRARIPDETYSYIFRIIAAAAIGENPGLFGFDFDPPLQF